MKRLLLLLTLSLSLVVKAQTTDEAESPLKGKIINVIGDSYVKNHRRPLSEAWHSLVAERNGMTYRNYGRNGNCIVFDREAEGWGKPMLERYKEMNDTADYVLVIAGHNDAGKIGTSADTLRIFRDGLRRFCQLLIEKYPKAAIGFVTPWDVPRDGFAEVNRTIHEVCAEYSIPVLNAAEVGGIDVRNDDFRKQFFQGPNDTAHLNARGHELFYPTGLQFILSLKPRQTLEEAFRNPGNEARPIMIWQWMDGLVNENLIGAELEAYRDAGIGGVQQFLVGGEVQTLVRDEANAIGTDNWRRQMKRAIDECARLGLTFGTHNCPGWSSSAFPSVKPEYSMQKIVYTKSPYSPTPTLPERGGRRNNVSKKQTNNNKTIILPRPAIGETDSKFSARKETEETGEKVTPPYGGELEGGFYRDIAVIAIPDSNVVSSSSIIILTEKMTAAGTLDVSSLPDGDWRIYRFGHTSNGKTNYATAPTGGVGLECDKMSREALDHYWSGYPSMLLELAGENAGRTFQRFEIDSYEAGGQEWTRLLPEEFLKRKKYDIIPWLPAIIGITIDSEAATKKFQKDWEDVCTSLVAENYYGYMSELIHKIPGMRLLAQPYATGGSKPFKPVDTRKAISRLAADDVVCVEFWTQPTNWGWPQVPGQMDAARRGGYERIFAEGFTCWPLHAWKDDPDVLKRTADRAFCLGVNSLMLHAGAHNPWPNARPGMTFGQWGTQWTPGQTWWQSGGAKELFTYMARCQALLQRGRFVDDFRSKNVEFRIDNAELSKSLPWTHRRDGDTDIYFIANQADTAITADIEIPIDGRQPEIWNPEKNTIEAAQKWKRNEGKTIVNLDMNAGDALFLVFQKETEENQMGKTIFKAPSPLGERVGVRGPWAVTFEDKTLPLAALTSWHESPAPEVKYFSGTATYKTTVKLKKLDKRARYTLDLGEVKNLARVRINGREVAHLWRPPFRCDITDALRKGVNEIEIDVTNLWVNRLVGDEQEPDDIEWGEPYIFGPKSDAGSAGRFMKKVPDWLRDNQPRPSKNRRAVPSFKFYEKDAELLPSGLLGPVTITLQK